MSRNNYNMRNGFSRPEASGGDDNPLAIYGSVDVNGTIYDGTALFTSTTVTTYSVTAATIPNSGIALIVGGTGLALTLAAPVVGSYVRLKLISISSGSVTVKTPAGVTFDGTNNTATFNAQDDELEIGYYSATQWVIIYNNSVTLSST